MRKKLSREFIKIFCLLLLLSCIPFCNVRSVYANVQKMANLVIFVKMKGDERDIYNAVYETSTYSISNWEQIRKMYDGGTGYQDDNSFSNYIKTVSEGQIEVVNIFPQEYVDQVDNKTKVKTYELSQSHYDYDVAMVSEVVQAIQSGAIEIDSSIKMDYVDNHVLDNLTIVVQGEDINGFDHSYKSEYSGSETIGSGLLVRNYNAFHSSSLVSDDASINVSQQQGVIAHEFLHVLGFPDLYRLDGGGIPVGMWDVMGGVTCFLQYPLGYLRAKKGWIQSQEITSPGTYTLRDVTQSGGNKLFTIKTPLAESDSEIICLEYRRLSDDINGFEHIIGYEGGLLMYRINNNIADETNGKGENYIYVYRPDVTDPESGNDVNENNISTVGKAALNVKNGEVEYGSTDLSKSYSDNTLYYSDGQNSGVLIKNCRLSEDGNDLTFDIEFADYSNNNDLWDAVGSPINGNGTIENPTIFTNNSDLYIAYMEINGASVTSHFKKWNDNKNAWEQAAPSLSDCSIKSPIQVAIINNQMVAVYARSSDDIPVVRKYNGSVWSSPQILSNTPYPMNLQLFIDEQELFVAYQYLKDSNSNSICLINLSTMKVLDKDSVIVKDFSNPSFLKDGNYIYMAYTDFADGSSKIGRFDCTTSIWSTVHNLNVPYANCHYALKDDARKIFYFSHTDSEPIISIYDDESWEDIPVSEIKSSKMPSINIINGEIVLCYLDSNNKLIVLKQENDSFVKLSATSYPQLLYLDICNISNTLFSVSKVINSTSITVRKKAIPSNKNPIVLSIVPPTDYTDNYIWIDGKEIATDIKDGKLQIILNDTNAKTAVMYKYNNKNIPIGMSAWKLTYSNGQVKAELLSGLNDILSYHGFSIRVQSPAGIRFKSGIDQELKKKLTSGTVDGYSLLEYGTLFMTQENREIYPFVKGGAKVGGGRAYWISNGVVNDKVFEIINSRIRFTSVLINLTKDQYDTDIVFRSYIILTDGNNEITLYGPPVAKSVYTVAKQVLASGEFKTGSNGYNYVKGIVDYVEQK